MDRQIRPTVLVAYGEDGLRWLKNVQSELKAAGLEVWFERGVWQCWVIGCQSSDTSILSVNPADVSGLRERIDRARPADLAFEVPSFRPRAVLIVERSSVLASAATARTELRLSLEETRRVQPQADASFDLFWLTFADTVRMPPDSSAAANAQYFFATEIPQRSLLVDRLTDVNAVVREDIADWLLGELAVAALTSDLLCPPALVGHDARVPEFDDVAQPGDVTPVGFVLFRHEEHTLLSMLAADLEQRLRNGAEQTVAETLAEDFRSISSLNEQIRNDIGGRVAVSTLDQRRAVVSAFLTRHLADSSWDLAVQEVTQAKRTLRQHRADGTHPAPAALAVSAADDWGTWGIAVGLLALAALGAWLLFRKKNAVRLEDSLPAGDAIESSDAVAYWQDLLFRLGAIAEEMEKRMRETGDQGSRQHWQTGATSFEWVYSAGQAAHSLTVSGSAIRSMREHLVRWVSRSDLKENAAAGVSTALRATSQSLLRQDSGLARQLRTQILGSLRHEFSERLPNLRPMAKGAQENHEAQVVWLTASPDADGTLVQAAERGAAARNCRVLSWDRDGMTARIVIGRSVHWTTITSLSDYGPSL